MKTISRHFFIAPKFKFIGETNVRGVCKNRWECPYCRSDPKMPECRFNLNKGKKTHRCRFCKRELEFEVLKQ